MNGFSVILLSVFLFGFYVSNGIIYRDSQNKLFILGNLTVLATSILAFWEFEISKVREIEALAWYANIHTSLIVPPLYLGVLSCWAFMKTSIQEPITRFDKILLGIFSTPPLLVLFGIFFINKGLFEDFNFQNGLWSYKLRSDLDWFMTSFMLFSFFSLVLFNYSVWQYCKRGNTKLSNIRANILIALTLLTSCSLVYFFTFNGEIQQQGFFFLSPLIIICWVGLAWPFSNYKLFVLSPITALDNIMDSVSNLVAISDNDLNIKYMNRIAREELGIRSADLSSLSIDKIIEITNYKDGEFAIKKLNQLKDQEKFQTTFSIKSGANESFFNLSISPVFDDLNRKKGYILLATNITLLKEAELKLKSNNKELEASNAELERFAYIASHDLKTPLRSVVSFLNLIERKVLKYNDKDLIDFIHIANSSASQMSHLIQDVLEFSQINNYKQKKNVRVDLNEVIVKIKQILQPIIKKKKCYIHAEELPIVMGDNVRLSQLFQNLIENGLKYNKSENPTINIQYEKRSKFHIFYFSDNGIGIKPEYQRRVFEMFKRLHSFNEYEGTGIGLAICKKIAQSYGGNIRITSKEGEGSTFKVYLKLEEVKPELELLESMS